MPFNIGLPSVSQAQDIGRETRLFPVC
jgi:hypothetical protein